MDPAGGFWADGSASRDAWVNAARSFVVPALAFQSAARSEIRLPGSASWHGAPADGLEALARVLLLESFAGCQEPRVAPTTQVLLEGVSAGVTSPSEPWIRAAENVHALVEAPSLCLALWVGRHRLWHELPHPVQLSLATWLAECADQFEGRSNNWMLFPFVVSRFLDSVDHPHPRRREIEDTTRRRLAGLYRGGGWYSDGGTATFDYYNAYAFHFYPGIVGALSADAELRERSATRLARFVPDLLSLIARDGSPVYFGRSMAYRFGIAAPLSVAPLVGVSDPHPAELREVTRRLVDFFVMGGGAVPGVPLVPGWGRDDTDLVQDYSGPGAAYWAAHAFSNLLLAPDHPYWQPWDASPPAEGGTKRLEQPNLLLAGPPDRSIVRLLNHGSFDVNTTSVKQRADDPYYGRLGYSSATVPLVNGEADSAFTVHIGDRRYRRARIAGGDGGTDWASSRGWLRDVDGGPEGREPAGFLSLATPSWDIHLMTLPRWARRRHASVSFRGWSVGDAQRAGTATTDGATVAVSAELTTSVHGLLGFTAAEVVTGDRPRGRYLLGEVAGHADDGMYAVATALGSTAPETPTLVRTARNRWVIRVAGDADRLVRRRLNRLSVSPSRGRRDG